MPARVLTAQLRQMQERGPLKRPVCAKAPPRVEYTPAEPGYGLKPVPGAMQSRGWECKVKNSPWAIRDTMNGQW